MFGLTVDDVDFEHQEVAFRPNGWRGLKTRQSNRRVPLWPQLQEMLEQHLEERTEESPLLFPARDGAMLRTLRWSPSTLEERAELDKHLTIKVFRHTYTATRLQTLDRGEPVSLFTVARELGHSGVDQIRDTYGHLQRRRSRLDQARYEEAEVIDFDSRRHG